MTARRQRYLYLLEHYGKKQPTLVGIFTSKREAEKVLRRSPLKLTYSLYSLPLNKKVTKGTKLEDVLGNFDHWHYGRGPIEIAGYDDKGRFYRRTVVQRYWGR